MCMCMRVGVDILAVMVAGEVIYIAKGNGDLTKCGADEIVSTSHSGTYMHTYIHTYL